MLIKLLNNLSSCEALYKKNPYYTHHRAYGCLCFPYLRSFNRHKLEPCSLPCVFLGYAAQYKVFFISRTDISKSVYFSSCCS